MHCSHKQEKEQPGTLGPSLFYDEVRMISLVTAALNNIKLRVNETARKSNALNIIKLRVNQMISLVTAALNIKLRDANQMNVPCTQRT